MRILFISLEYPDERNTAFAFVKQLVDEVARQGNTCYVIAPYSIVKNRRFHKQKESSKFESGGSVTIFRPNILSFSTLHIGSIYLSSVFRNLAIKKALKWLPEKPDVVYGHFWNCGLDGYDYAKKNNIPLFVATGESTYDGIDGENERFKDFTEYVKGVICVSSKNRDESINHGFTNKDKCIVVPNSVNPALFRKLDRNECRKELGISEDKFIVSFVGWFSIRKGSRRVSAAIDKISGEPVYSFFIGEEEQVPDCKNILYLGTLKHEQIPLYLNASDVFVLPTLNEGCCNSVIEAMACGLPVISSDLPFNYDVLDDTNSIMVDPNDVDEIANAITTLRDDKELRSRLSVGALRKAENLTIGYRAKTILSFIENKLI